jgi:hypothetical protein
MSRPGPHSERAIILAPNGRDSQIAALILKEAGYPAEIRADLPSLCEELDKGAGLAIIADEAIDSVVRTAVRSRRRQYEARARLEDLSEGEQRLQTALTAGRLGAGCREHGPKRVGELSRSLWSPASR